MSQDMFAKDSTAATTASAKALAKALADAAQPGTVERIQVHHAVAKRLGNWTAADTFEIRARGGNVVIDLRSPGIPDVVEVDVEAQRALVKLLVPEGAVVEHGDLRWSGKGRVKDGQAPADGAGRAAGRRIRLLGHVADGEIRVHRGGVATLSAMLTREYVDDLRRARKEGRLPTVDDPTRDPCADPHRASA